MDADDQKLIEEWLRARGWEQRGKDFFVQPGVEGTAHFVSILQASRDLPALIRAWNESQWTRIEPGCKMPADEERVLVVLWDWYVCEACHFASMWSYKGGKVGEDSVSYWRYMPAVPKEGEG